MASVNKVIIVGNVGRDPESRTFPSGDMVCNISVATTEKWRDKSSGENREHTEWHRVKLSGRNAETAAQYIKKGSQVYIEGKLKTRKWTDQATGQERYATEIEAAFYQLLGGRPQEGGGSGDGGGYDQGGGQQQRAAAPAQQSRAPAQGRAPAPAPRAASGFDDMDDDIPF